MRLACRKWSTGTASTAAATSSAVCEHPVREGSASVWATAQLARQLVAATARFGRHLPGAERMKTTLAAAEAPPLECGWVVGAAGPPPSRLQLSAWLPDWRPGCAGDAHVEASCACFVQTSCSGTLHEQEAQHAALHLSEVSLRVLHLCEVCRLRCSCLQH